MVNRVAKQSSTTTLFFLIKKKKKREKKRKGRKEEKEEREKKVYSEKWPNNASRSHVDSGRGRWDPHTRPGAMGPVSKSRTTYFWTWDLVSLQETRAVIFLSILHVLLFPWSVQVAFLQHGWSEAHIIRWWVQGNFRENLWWDFRTAPSNYGLKMEALAALHV